MCRPVFYFTDFSPRRKRFICIQDMHHFKNLYFVNKIYKRCGIEIDSWYFFLHDTRYDRYIYMINVVA